MMKIGKFNGLINDRDIGEKAREEILPFPYIAMSNAIPNKEDLGSVLAGYDIHQEVEISTAIVSYCKEIDLTSNG